jgi:pimeloyl-ACP methyl ester carboxylesterase
MGELATTLAAWPWLLEQSPRGDGHPVLVFPGFAASDLSTRPLRRFLKRLGYRAHRWELGRNLGHSDRLLSDMTDRMEWVYQQHGGQPISLIGWSLGGVYARVLANRHPEKVRSVICLGSPFTNNLKANRAWRFYQWITGRRLDEVDPELLEEVRRTPPVPTTSIYSHSDGITSWQCSIEAPGPLAENVRVAGSHLGLGFNPLVLHAIADRLAQPQDGWKKFARTGWRRRVYPRPDPRPEPRPDPRPDPRNA